MRRAFTLLELLVATALTAVLMAVVLQVIGAIGRDRGRLPEPPVAQAWRSDLLGTLRRDLGGSTAVRFGPGSMTLTGTSALGRRSMSAGDEPVTVTYAVRSLHGRNWLTRRQAGRNGRGDDAPWSELLCPDVTGFAARPAAVTPGDAGAAGAPVATGDAPQAVPASVVVRIDFTGEAPVDEVLVLR